MHSTLQTRWLLLLTVAACLHGFALRRWVVMDTRPLAWDQATHTKIAFEYIDRFSMEGFSRLFRPVDFNYPPLYHLALIPVVARVRDVADAGALVNFVYLCVLLLAVFFIGYQLMGPWEGGAAAVLVSCYPLLVYLSRQTLIDFSLTAWVSLSFLCLIKSDGFSKPAWSILFGAVLGLSMLTKWTAPAYLVGPLLPVLWRMMKNKNFFGFGSAVFCAVVVISPWYITNFVPMLSGLPKLAALPPATGHAPQQAAKMFWYVLALQEQLGRPLLLLLVPGLAALIWRPKLTPVLLWFVGSLFIFSFLHNKNIRYTAPALPAAALLSVGWLPPRRIAYAAVSVLAIAICFKTIEPPMAGDWKHEMIIQAIVARKNADQPVARVLVVSNHARIHSTTLNVSARARRINSISFSGVGKRRWFEFADFVLVKTGDIGPWLTAQHVRDCADFLAKPPSWFRRVYKEVGRWPLPDNSEAVLYQCKPDVQAIPDVGIFNLSLEELELPNVHATGVEIKAVPLSARDTQLGRLKEMRIRCKTVDYKTIRFEDVDIRLDHPQINVPLFFETQEIQLNALRVLEPHATVSADTLLVYAAKKAKWLINPSVSFDGSRIQVSGTVGICPVEIVAEAYVQGDWFKTRLIKVKLAHFPFPLVLLRAFSDQTIDLKINKDRPYALNLGRIQGNQTQLRIGS